MVKVNQLEDASVLETKARKREVSPTTLERRLQAELFEAAIAQLTDTSKAFQVELEVTDKAVTVRQRLLRAARDQGVEIAVRRHGDGFAVGLMTPARRSNRGHRRGGAGSQRP